MRTLASRVAAMATFACLWAASPATAAGLWCDGTLANLWVDAGGTVFVQPSWRGDYVQVCNVNQPTANGLQPTTCLSWLSLMRSAVQRNAATVIHYSDAPVATCNAMPTYSAAPTPYYVMLRN